MLGIYAIVHRESNRMYVGQSNNINKRFSQHRKALQQGTHYNRKLQRAWSKYGEQAFEFRVLEECEADCLTQREQHYLNQKPWFNICMYADSAMRGRTHSEEVRKKMSEAWNERRKRGPMKFRPRTEEEKAHLSAKLKGRKLPAETRAKMSAAQKGKRNSPEAAEKVRQAKLGVPNVKVRKPVRCIETGQVFDSLKSAAEFYGGDSGHLSAHLKGRKPRFKGHTFTYEERT